MKCENKCCGFYRVIEVVDWLSAMWRSSYTQRNWYDDKIFPSIQLSRTVIWDNAIYNRHIALNQL